VTRTIEVDATGLSCPRPVLELAAAVSNAAIGDVIELTATDPAARVDVAVWCRLHQHRLRSVDELGSGWRFAVERRR
jgi:tRNA 2-thiouridine synthesizing protein A